MALLDSNVIIASLAEGHEHHEASIALFSLFPDHSFAVAAHCYSEAYSILTRKAQSSPFKWTAADALPPSKVLLCAAPWSVSRIDRLARLLAQCGL